MPLTIATIVATLAPLITSTGATETLLVTVLAGLVLDRRKLEKNIKNKQACIDRIMDRLHTGELSHREAVHELASLLSQMRNKF